MIRKARSGRDGDVRVTCVLPADEPAGPVSVVGDFNGWDPLAHPLQRRANGTRSAAVTVRTGTTLHFRYLADGGIWFDDDTVPAGGGADRPSRPDRLPPVRRSPQGHQPLFTTSHFTAIVEDKGLSCPAAGSLLARVPAAPAAVPAARTPQGAPVPYRIVEVAPTGQLFAAPRHPCTRALLAAIPRLTSSLDGTGPPAIARSPRVPDYQAACHFAFGQVPDNAAGTPVTNVAGEGGSGRR